MAYVIPKSPSSNKVLPYLPETCTLTKTGEIVVFDRYKDSDEEQVFSMMTQAVDEGQSYPQSEMDGDHFHSYYLSHDAFVARQPTTHTVLGSFYVKPNFPGRSSHICNGGFLVNVDCRGKGVGELLFKKYLRVARDLGYKGSFFNLVYASNTASLKLCRRLGFTEIGVVPKAGFLKDLGYVDAVQFYYDLTTLNENGEPYDGWPSENLSN